MLDFNYAPKYEIVEGFVSCTAKILHCANVAYFSIRGGTGLPTQLLLASTGLEKIFSTLSLGLHMIKYFSHHHYYEKPAIL